ncbi:putative ABC transport system permease protein [Povalibacter uvarum]|uniref:Putative ABC transport system permease protein n=1 Tax=Povalibacter uvarum TaxID=732238 RepID=A0A841HQE1_9GAMM|nr:ABC transporter permease [Povalibacter uvarum]MBB6094450.1 putative ABC transport system permease protein [Povalibacter uvarum]
MKMLRQIGSVTAMNLRSLRQRASTSLVIVIGIAGVVAVLISVLAMSTGMIKTMNNAGRDDRAIVLRNGSASDASSVLARDAVRLITEGAAVKRDGEGKPIASPESMRRVTLFKKDDGAEVNVLLRGVGTQFERVRPELKIIEGRMFAPAVNEVIVGKSANAQFKGLNVGDQITTRGAVWKVVGIFSSGGDVHESEMMADVETVNSAERRGGFQSVVVLLESPGAFAQFKDSLTSNPALAVDVHRERDYYKQQSKTISRIIFYIAYVVGGIMAVGAVFGALNTMYSAVSARVREIATLRALGFGSTAMVLSVLVEALLLALIGGAVGALIAWLFFNGHVVSTSGGGGAATQLVFELTVSPQLVATGIIWACLIGLIGGLFPAIRAARLPVAEALRAV